MSLQTPDAIRTLQRKLYGKAKAEPAFRFYILYAKVWRTDILAHAYQLARANDGAPGVAGVTFDRIEAAGLEDGPRNCERRRIGASSGVSFTARERAETPKCGG